MQVEVKADVGTGWELGIAVPVRSDLISMFILLGLTTILTLGFMF
jgi:hypothetical protein